MALRNVYDSQQWQQPLRGLNAFYMYLYQIVALESVVVKTQKL